MQTTLGYIRLSDEDQSQYSITFQEKGIRDYCLRNNLPEPMIFLDNGQSSYTFDRKAFRNLELEIKRKKPRYLIVYHLDRFSRNLAEAMTKVKEYYAKGILVRDISEPVDLDDEDPNTFLLRAMKFMAAESELHRIRQRTKSGVRQAALDGRHANLAPYGYVNERDDRGRAILTIKDEEAFIIRIVFREYLNGMELEAVRKLANRYGYKQKGNSAMRRLLGNPVYAGMIRVPANRHTPTKLVTGIHTALISEQDYWLVQERLNEKTKTRQDREEVPLRGVLHCWCGAKVTAGNSKSKSGRYYWYYLCLKHKKNMPAARLHAQFNELLDELSFDNDTLKHFRKKFITKLDNYLATRDAKMADVRKQLDLVERRIETTEEKYLRKADISERAYDKVMTEYKADRSRLYKEITTLNTNQQAHWDHLNSVLLHFSNIKAAFEGFSLQKKQQFINLVFDNSLTYENEIYRTPKLHELFAHKILTLKEKGLLEISNPVINLGATPVRSEDGSPIEHLEAFYRIFVA